MNLKLITLFLTFVQLNAIAGEVDTSKLSDLEFDFFQTSMMTSECQNNKKFLDHKFNIRCEANYHHYNSASKKNYNKMQAIDAKDVKIAEFNALHPGMGKTRFKDYKKVAMLLNKFDVIGVTELIPLMGEDLENNEFLIEFANSAPQEIADAKKEIKELERALRRRRSVVKERNLYLLKSKLEQLQEDLKKISTVYRTPGYLKILDELHKLDGGSDWSLLLAPRGEGAKTSNTLELVGYYYRSNIVKPYDNPYCKEIREIGNAAPIACIINMDAEDLGVNKKHIISRRPFMANFVAGKFSFTLITSHILFDSPSEDETMQEYMQLAFGVDDYQHYGRGSGITKSNYARFVEAKITLDFIKKYTSKYPRTDVIYMGDFNIEKNTPFNDVLLQAWPGSEMFIDQATSLSNSRYNSDGEETNGVSSNYDHFIFNPKKTSECVTSDGKLNGGAFNFQKGRFAGYINRTYRVRTGRANQNGIYRVDNAKYDKLIQKHVTPMVSMEEPIYTIGKVVHRYANKYTLSSRGIVPSEKESYEYAKYFQERVLDSQLSDDSYYYFYEQLISDHLPIYMSCKTN